MIQKETIEEIVAEFIAGTEFFVVEIKTNPANNIQVSIDHNKGVDIDTCIELSRFIESKLDREVEDFELEVSSAGISDPFKVYKQYIKNIGKEISITFKDGKKVTGTLLTVTDTELTLDFEEIQKLGPKGKKKKVQQTGVFALENIKQTILVITVK